MATTPVRPVQTAAGSPAAAEAATLPFDYTAVFPLRGDPGNIVQDVIVISPESDFVAAGISYGFQPSRDGVVIVPPAGVATLGDLTLGSFPLAAWLDGIRLNPRQLGRTVNGDPPLLVSSTPANGAFVRAVSPAALRFSFAAIDTSSGRELQDQPLNNLAALGESTGRRPFRRFPQPFFLARNSTIRLQVTEESENALGDLFVVLFGYKVNSEPCGRTPIAPITGSRVIPFDYVARVPLSGVAGRRVEREIILDTGGGFRVASLGYALNSGPDNVPVTFDPIDPPSDLRLANLNISVIPASAWLEGIRLRPGFLPDAVKDGKLTDDVVPDPRLQQIFQRLNRPEDTFFRYEITEGGTGRELQNRPILNIAGLGSADGRRPFKQFIRPLEFGPRSTIRVAIEEASGSGDLFLVFQGYRNDNRTGGRR